jgi:hypothetical protein
MERQRRYEVREEEEELQPPPVQMVNPVEISDLFARMVI